MKFIATPDEYDRIHRDLFTSAREKNEKGK